MEEIRSKYQAKNYHIVSMTTIECPYCRGTYMVDLGYAPLHHGNPATETRDFAEVHCPYCMKEIWYAI